MLSVDYFIEAIPVSEIRFRLKETIIQAEKPSIKHGTLVSDQNLLEAFDIPVRLRKIKLKKEFKS